MLVSTGIGCCSQLTVRRDTADETQGFISTHSGMKTGPGKRSPASLTFTFSFHPNLPTPGSLRVCSQPSACKALLLPAARQMSSGLRPIHVRPLIYNPEPKERGLQRPDHHLAFAINLEGNTDPRVNGPPRAGPCGTGVQVEGSGARTWEG